MRCGGALDFERVTFGFAALIVLIDDVERQRVHAGLDRNEAQQFSATLAGGERQVGAAVDLLRPIILQRNFTAAGAVFGGEFNFGFRGHCFRTGNFRDRLGLGDRRARRYDGFGHVDREFAGLAVAGSIVDHERDDVAAGLGDFERPFLLLAVRRRIFNLRAAFGFIGPAVAQRLLIRAERLRAGEHDAIADDRAFLPGDDGGRFQLRRVLHADLRLSDG